MRSPALSSKSPRFSTARGVNTAKGPVVLAFRSASLGNELQRCPKRGQLDTTPSRLGQS